MSASGYRFLCAERILTNYHLEEMVDTSDEWILERTGIRERRIARDDETNVTMGRTALERAIENAGIGPEEIDLLIVGTNTTNPVWPSAAGHMPAPSVSGREFLFLMSRQDARVLTILSPWPSNSSSQDSTERLQWLDRTSCPPSPIIKTEIPVFYSGRAGAVVLQQRREEGIIRSHLGGDYRRRTFSCSEKTGIMETDICGWTGERSISLPRGRWSKAASGP